MESVVLQGPEGRVSGYYHNSGATDAPFVLLLPHHPENGGHIGHTLVSTSANAFVNRGFNVFTFDFPGIGRSQGTFSSNEQIINTTASIFDMFAAELKPGVMKWVCGISFGAWVALQMLMRRPGINSFTAISLPITNYDCNFLSPCPVPGNMIVAEKDALLEKRDAVDFVDRIKEVSGFDLNLQFIKGADHLYTKKQHLKDLEQAIDEGIRNNLNTAKMAV